jgi:integrase
LLREFRRVIQIVLVHRERRDDLRRLVLHRVGALHLIVPRTIDVSPATLQVLRAHKSHQAEIKLKNRRHYHDHELVFAKEWGELSRKHDVLGQPLQMNNLGEREYARVIKAADVRPITFHGLRHTCATLLFAAGVPVKVIQERLGHKRIEITLDIYAHVLPSMQREAATRLAGLLHG